jgi:hypothetical protein
MLLVLIAIAVFVFGRRSPTVAEPDDMVEADPVEELPAALETDIEADPPVVALQPTDVEPAASGMPPEARSAIASIRRWLEAGRQKRVVPDAFKLHVPAAWWQNAPAEPRTLVVEVEIQNLSESRFLEYRGWTVAPSLDTARTAFIIGSGRREVIPARADDSPLLDSSPFQQIAPTQTLRIRLVFPLDAPPETERIRMILPYAGLGLTGYAGVEIPTVMISGAPPEAAPTTDPFAASGPRKPDAAAIEEAEAGAAGGETIVDLRSQIQASVEEPESEELPVEAMAPGKETSVIPEAKTPKGPRESRERSREGS